MKRRSLAILLIFLVAALMLNVSTASAASTKSVYVISTMSFKTVSDNGNVYTDKITFKYNKNGLLSSYKAEKYQYGTFKYKGKQLKSSEVQTGDGVPEKCTYTWKNGKLVSAHDTNNGIIRDFKYNKKGKISNLVATSDYSGNMVYEMDFKYNSSKRLTKQLIGKSAYVYKYNTKGRLIKFDNIGAVYKFKNTLKSGRVSKIVETLSSLPKYKRTITIKYKKITVPSGYVTLIKRQKNYLLLDLAYRTNVNDLPLGLA